MTSSFRQHVGQSSYIGHRRSTRALCLIATRKETALCARHSQSGRARKPEIAQRPYSQLSKSRRKLSLHLRHERKAPTKVLTKCTPPSMPASCATLPSTARLSSPRSVRPLTPRAATAVSVTCSRVHMMQELPVHVAYSSSPPVSRATSARPSRGSKMPVWRAHVARCLRNSPGSAEGPSFRSVCASSPSSRPLTGKLCARNHAESTAAWCRDSR
mmetsp:Transcript_102646/g.319868  ORF Transcript_102646/g.319868 Transcript_102646/m.319868 type:complete len:215 (-) Transcript_102646:599-1243(-)